MKENVSAAIIVLAVSLFGLESCSDSTPIEVRYEAEKMLYQAERSLAEARRSQSGQLSLYQADQLCPQFRNCIDFCYESLDKVDPQTYPTEYQQLVSVAHRCSMQLAGLFFSVNRFDSSIATINRLLLEFRLDAGQQIAASLDLAQALHAGGKWDSALAVYDATVSRFYPPVSAGGEPIVALLGVPAHVFRVVTATGNSTAASGALAAAEGYYTRLTREFPNSKVSAVAHFTLADLYGSNKLWEKELEQLRAISDTSYPGHRDILMRMADVHRLGLRQYDTALAIYDYLMNTSTPDDSGRAPEILFRISLTRMDQNRYREARNLLNTIKKEYPMFFDSLPTPQYTLARSLELEGNWERAETEYSLLIEKFRDSDEAMMALLYMVDNLRAKGRTVESEQWHRRAQAYFDEAASRYPGTPVHAKALFYKADLFRRSSQYERSVQVLLSLYEKFPGSEPGRRALMAAARMYREQLNNPGRADSLLMLAKSSISTAIPTLENPDLSAD
ncbi:MAG: tetratricopeptide repeat protein [Candidatus Zixiibacteriota bacterium]|nr:MAG: tetratricopeptide repeat protein [candidate division Zixibacteria bacterium]